MYEASRSSTEDRDFLMEIILASRWVFFEVSVESMKGLEYRSIDTSLGHPTHKYESSYPEFTN
jgi:hypothetical protein